jgi:hypothetical protein
LTPDFDFNETVVDVTADKKRELTLTFLDKIKSSDAIYVIDIDGYVGRSVAIEVGYAAALGLKILLLEQPAELAVRALATGVLGIEELTVDVFC